MTIENRLGRQWLLVLLLALPLLLCRIGRAQPRLDQVPNSELQSTYQTGKSYTLRLQYRDPNGDDITKAKSLFIDESQAGTQQYPATNIQGDPTNGAIIEWQINGLAAGKHNARFEVTNSAAKKATYKSAQEPYAFAVEDIVTKWIILGIGLIVCLAAVPLLTYLLARAISPRGDPSRTARIGLWVGILLACLLFIYLFANTFGLLTYAILIIGILALPILLLNRR